MLAIVVGRPVALLAVIGNPLPDLSRANLGASLGSGRQSAEFVIKVLACVAWLAWAQVAACLLVELVAGVRGTGMPWRVAVAGGGPQDLPPPPVTPGALPGPPPHGRDTTAGPHPPAHRPPAPPRPPRAP